MTIRPATTNRGLWLARHTRLQIRRIPCEPGCPVCDEHAGYQADYTAPPPTSLARDLAPTPITVPRKGMPHHITKPQRDPDGLSLNYDG